MVATRRSPIKMKMPVVVRDDPWCGGGYVGGVAASIQDQGPAGVFLRTQIFAVLAGITILRVPPERSEADPTTASPAFLNSMSIE